jgi:putative ABC transport system permease protein
MNASRLLEGLWQDFRYGARLLRMNPGFFAVATISLALGIGANTAIFELLNAVRLRMLPIAHAEQLAELQIAENEHCCSGNFSDRRPNFTYPQWEQIRKHQQAFSGIFAWGDSRFNMAVGGEARFAEGLWVSGQFFQTLGTRPLLGRLIADDDDTPGCGSPGAVISYPFWQREFGGDSQVLGKKVSLDGHQVEVIGVTPPEFFGVEVGKNFDVAVPLCAEPLINGENSHTAKRHHWWLAVIGRLKPGWTVERATAQAAAMSPAVFETTVPPNYRPDAAKFYAQYKLTAMPAGSGVSSLRRQYEQPLLLLLGIAGLVLLIACANLANLTLARASTREREMAVRLAIGADRGRLIRQLLAESLLLTLIGTAFGVFLAQLLGNNLVRFLTTSDNPLFLKLEPDWRVLAFTSGVAILTCILFGLTPALRATRTAPSAAMKASGRGLTADRERFGLRRALVIGQVALSLVLLIGALLFVGSLRNLMTLDPGFRQDGLLLAGVDISRLNYPVTRRAVFYRELLDRLRATPGVERAASVNIVPISGSGWNDTIEILGESTKERMVPWFNRVSSGYFQTMGTPLLAGRDFDEHDTPSSPEVAIVNQEFSKKFLGGKDPIGKQVRLLAGPGEDQHVFQIVGLLRNSKYRNLRDNFVPTVFVAASQNKEPGMGISIVLRSAIPTASLQQAVKKAILAQNSGTSVQFQVFKTQVQESLLKERLMATLSGFFGFLAAILATVGLYGVISYMVARRRNEIGIRIALGASKLNVMNLVLREAAILIATGLVIGSALAIAVARTASSLLYGLQPSDPITVGVADALLACVAIFASLLPALRAARLEPMNALREE